MKYTHLALIGVVAAQEWNTDWGEDWDKAAKEWEDAATEYSAGVTQVV